MYKNNLHRQLHRQIKKNFTDQFILENESVQKFIDVINQSYLNYEKDAELSEQSSNLDGIEYSHINQKLKEELDKKENFQIKLIEAIKQLSNIEIELGNKVGLIDLLQILDEEIISRKKFQEELFNAKLIAEKANEAKSDFLSIMSHEIRTPLNAIIGLIYIMEKENTIESFHENLGVLKHSAQNLFLLINDILDFNKIEAGKIDLEKIPFNLKELVLQIVKSLAMKSAENENTIEVIFDDHFIPNVISDPLRIGQIITNLLSNAIKFTKNGLVQIKIDSICQKQNFSSFKVQIIDNGIGIDVKKFEHIFQKFEQAEKKTTRQFGGTGLGLVITKKLLHLLRSDIVLQSEIGIGSNFSFVLELPSFIANAEVEQSFLYHDYKDENLEGMKVLLVEDNMINVKIAEKILKQWNVVVDKAENGLVCIQKFTSNSYDVILMDLSMPVMDGYEATSIIRSTDSNIPIIALTASASYGYLEKALLIGISEYIVKPFNPKELNLKLKKYYKP